MIRMTILQAILISLFYWFKQCRFGYTLGVPLLFTPLPAALWVGLVLGDVSTAMKVGAALQLIYLGLLAPGGAAPADPTIAALISCSVAIVGKINLSAAVALAVPVGVIFQQLIQIEHIINTFLARVTDKMVDKANIKGMFIASVLVPTLYKLVLYALPVALILFFGASQVGNIINMVPKTILSGLALAGSVLPAVGFAIIVQQIGKNSLLPYFFAAFFLEQYSHIPTIAVAMVGLFLAYLYTTSTSKQMEE